MLWFHFFPVPTQCLPLQDILPLMIQRLDVFLCGYCSNTILCLSYIAFGLEPKLEIWFILFPPSVFPSVFNLPSTGEWPFPLPVVFVWIDLIQTSLHTHTHISSLCFTFSLPAGAKLSKKMSSPGCSVGGGVPCQGCCLSMWVRGISLLMLGQFSSPSQSQSATVSVWSLDLCAVFLRELSVFVQLGVKSTV